jgi:hypothetical protein
MKRLSVEQQIDNLRPTVGFAAQMHKWLLLGAALGVIASLLIWNPIPLMFSVFLAVVGFSEKRAGPNIVAAISAYDSEAPAPGNASITITCWDMDNHYHVRLHEEGHPDWTYEFVPQGWQPAAGSHAAKVWRSGLEGKPVLSVVKEGVMIPRYDPKTVSE